MTEARLPTVLNVNDQVANLYLVTKVLRNAGFAVVEARTGGEALARAAETNPDVIVLDIRLPDVSGFEVCRRIKSDPRTRDIKVLHTSATYVSTDSKIEGLESGADGYLTQPFEPQDLVATVRSLARLRSAEADLQARNRALLEADRRKDEFLAMLAHELRNPLAALLSALPLLERHAPRDSIEERTRAVCRRQTAQLVRLVDDLLDVSRVTRGRISLQLAPVDLGRLVRSVADGMRERLEARGQAIAVSGSAEPVVVRGDAARLEQVLTNLLDNAAKYSEPNEAIEVSLTTLGERAALVIRDHGAGIDAATLPAIFDLFAQGATTLARSRGGLGIGLTLAKAIVELHGGSIGASSPGVGAGTEIRVELPLELGAAAEEPASPLAAPVPAERPCRILLVDDNDDGREMLRALCELTGHEVIEAADGTSGVERALAARPALALVDIGLPGIDGYEVARRVRAGLGRAPYLVALSGYGSEQDRQRALAAGFDEHIAKPIPLETLERVIAAATVTAR